MGIAGERRDYGEYGALWVATAPELRFPALEHDTDVEVAVVGVTTAFLLKRAGRRVGVLEARRVGQQVTGGSTVKVATQHGLAYTRLASSLGRDAARLYGEANQAGLSFIRDIAANLDIACELEPRDAYTYSETGERLDDIRKEAELAAALGLPARFVEDAPLPFPIRGAVCFADQAQFHPVKFTVGLARAIPGDGSHVFEGTRVLDVGSAGETYRVVTERGLVTARHVVIATNLPVLDRGGFFARCFPQRHVALAAELEESGEAPDGLFLSTDSPPRSLRVYSRGILIAVGEAFKTGHADERRKLEELADWVRSHFHVKSFLYHWGNQDYTPLDGVPYVGRLLPGSDRLWVATGFNGWGMTNGAAAAEILTDAIAGNPNPWAGLYSATRLNPTISAGPFLSANLHVGKEFVAERLHRPKRRLADLAPGEGDVVAGENGKKVAAYRDPSGRLSVRSPVCTHLQCLVHWNALETSWDCPCHGSRFGIDGEVLNGPAVKPLAEVAAKE